MNSITKKAERASKYFSSHTRTNGDTFVILDEGAPESLRKAIRDAHGDKFPDDFIYGAFADLIEKVTEYEIDDENDLDEYRNEIVDGMVDIYTKDLLEWLASDINNIYLCDEVIEEYGQPKDTTALVSQAQYRAYDNVMEYVYQYLLDDTSDDDVCPECGSDIDKKYNCCSSNECEYMQ